MGEKPHHLDDLALVEEYSDGSEKQDARLLLFGSSVSSLMMEQYAVDLRAAELSRARLQEECHRDLGLESMPLHDGLGETKGSVESWVDETGSLPRLSSHDTQLTSLTIFTALA